MNFVHAWANDYVKYDGYDAEPVHISLCDSRGTGKSHLVKVIYNALSKILLYHWKDSEKPRVLLIGPAGVLAVNIRRDAIHSGLKINPRAKLLSLNSKPKTALRNTLSETKLLIVDELSMLSSDLSTDFDSRLGEILMMIPEKLFTGLSVMAVADFLQLP